MKKLLLLIWMGIMTLHICRAENNNKSFSLPHIISSNMILQQEQEVPIWGTASPGERIKLIFDKKKISVRANSHGDWKVMLPAMKADKQPHTLTISAKDTTVVCTNVMIGEVWLCSGQSNMEYRMKLLPNFAPPAKGIDLAAEELKKPENDMIRVFISDRRQSWDGWKVAGPESLPNVSAAGYFFAKKIQEELDVPVGIITAALGGTRIETWTPKEVYESSPVFAPILEKGKGRMQGVIPGECYSQLLKPTIPYGIKGFLWYQGENNCAIEDQMYAEEFKLMTERWRKDFSLPKAPFYYVVIGPCVYSDRMHRNSTAPTTAESLPLFCQQQIDARELVPNSEYITITDLVDNLHDGHSSYKWEVGARLANVALAKTYGKDSILWSGPRIKEWERQNDEIVITFDHCADGLKTNDKREFPRWFEIGTDDGFFRPALAKIISNNQIKVYHPDVKNPKHVRFGWHETALPNLVNSIGLPAVQFSTFEMERKR